MYKYLKLLEGTVASGADSYAGITPPLPLEQEHWASVEERKGVPMNSISAKSSYCLLKDTSVAGGWHQITIHGFLQPQNISGTDVASADGNSMT